MTQAHAFLPPSGASSWQRCSLWPTMNQRFPQDDSAEAIEGTAAHWVGWQLLAGNAIRAGDPAPGGTVITDEMIEGGELVVDTIHKRVPPDLKYYIEEQILISIIDADCFGTPDFWAWDHNRKRIEIVDYKFGHRFVDEWWNPQGLCYLAGIIEFLCKQWGIGWDKFDLTTGVGFTVVQPRCFYRGEPVRTHEFTVFEAIEHFNKLREQAQLTRAAEPTATTNNHCGDCPGRHACSALQAAAYTDAEYSNARTPVQLSPAAAALELRLLLRALDRLTARVDGLKEQTIANLRAGKQVPYFRAEQGYGRQQWNIPDSQIVAIGDMFGHNLRKEGTITPKQAEKAGVPPEIVKQYSASLSTGFRLVAENPTDAARTFGALKEPA